MKTSNKIQINEPTLVSNNTIFEAHTRMDDESPLILIFQREMFLRELRCHSAMNSVLSLLFPQVIVGRGKQK